MIKSKKSVYDFHIDSKIFNYVQLLIPHFILLENTGMENLNNMQLLKKTSTITQVQVNSFDKISAMRDK